MTAISQSAYAEILRAIDNLGSAREAATTAELELNEEVVRGLQAAPALVATLYWEHGIKASLLASALGVTLVQLAPLKGVDDVETICGCGDLFVARCRSHADRKAALDGRLSCLACKPHQYGGPERLPGRRDLERVAALRSMPYESYLLTPEWAETRTKALDRARHACQVCSSKYGLEVHHSYDRLGSEQPRDLTVLCRDCHRVFHQYGRLQL